jgi:hypothetical protein
MTLTRRFMIIKNRGRAQNLGRSFGKPRSSVMTSGTQMFGRARVRTCDASLSAGKQRNDTRTQALHRLVNKTNVRFRYNSGLLLDADSASSSGSPSNDLNWEMVAIWMFLVFSFAAFVFTGYVIWAKCDSPSPF